MIARFLRSHPQRADLVGVATDYFLSRQLGRLSRRTRWASDPRARWLIASLFIVSVIAGSIGTVSLYRAGVSDTDSGWLAVSKARLDLVRAMDLLQRDAVSPEASVEAASAFAQRRSAIEDQLEAIPTKDTRLKRAISVTEAIGAAIPTTDPTPNSLNIATALAAAQIATASRQSSLVGDEAFPDALIVELSRLLVVAGSLRTLPAGTEVSPEVFATVATPLAMVADDSLFAWDFDSVPAPDAFAAEYEAWRTSGEVKLLNDGLDQMLSGTAGAGGSAIATGPLLDAIDRSGSSLTILAQSAGASLSGDLNSRAEAQRGTALRYLYSGIALAFSATVVISLRQNRNRQADEDLRTSASTDVLTGLANRAMLESWVQDHAEECDEIVLMHIDLDHFKPVNDTYGHAVGDRVLQIAASRLSEVATNYGGLASRIGGDEFVVVLPPQDVDDLERISGRLVDSLIHYEVGGLDLTVGASIGVARGNGSFHDLLIDADLALYQAKRTGRGQASTFKSDAADFVDFIRAELDHGRVRAVYQPQVSLRDGRCIGVEVFARMVDEQGTLLQADGWLSIVEWIGRTDELFEHVITAVAADVDRVKDLACRLWFNVSPADLMRPRGAEWLLGQLARLGLDPEQVGIELTNVEDFNDPRRLSSVLSEIRAAGYGIALDEFGAKDAPLGHLRDLPVSRVKLNSGLVAQVNESMPPSAWMVKSLSDLARQLRIEVVAQGVASGKQLEFLAKLGIPTAQGYLLGLPGPMDRVPLGVNLRQLVGTAVSEVERRAQGSLISAPGSEPGAPTHGHDRRTVVRTEGDRRQVPGSGSPAAAGAGASAAGSGSTGSDDVDTATVGRPALAHLVGMPRRPERSAD